jgi:hypothetical protein
MPVLGDQSAATLGTCGSSARDSSAPSMLISTPLAVPVARIFSSAGSSSGLVATMSLPQRRCGMSCFSQISYSRRLPCTHSVAFSEPVG